MNVPNPEPGEPFHNVLGSFLFQILWKLFCSPFDSDIRIMTEFCTSANNRHARTCTELWPNLITIFQIRSNRIYEPQIRTSHKLAYIHTNGFTHKINSRTKRSQWKWIFILLNTYIHNTYIYLQFVKWCEKKPTMVNSDTYTVIFLLKKNEKN